MSEILSTKDLSIGYSREKALRSNINITASRGSLTVLVGCNGSGKSTLLRTIAGFSEPIKGDVFLDNKSLLSYSKKELSRRMSVVLTEILGDVQYLKVIEVVQMGRYPYSDCFATMSKGDDLAVERALQTVGIEDLAQKSMARISDGQRQKVMIAKALAQDTDVIVMDEPLSFLDAPAKIEIMNIASDLALKKNKCVIISSHDVDLACHFSQQLWMMDHENMVRQRRSGDISKLEVVECIFGEQAEGIKDFLVGSARFL